MRARFGSDPTAGSKILSFKFISRLLSSRLLVFSLRFLLPLSFSSCGLPRCLFVSSLFGNISSFILTCTCPGHVSGAQFCQLSKHQFQFVLLIILFPFTTVSLYTMCSRNPVIPPSHRRRGATTGFGQNRHGITVGSPVYFFAIARRFYTRHTGGAVPLRVMVQTAITVVTPPVVFKSFPLPVTHRPQ